MWRRLAIGFRGRYVLNLAGPIAEDLFLVYLQPGLRWYFAKNAALIGGTKYAGVYFVAALAAATVIMAVVREAETGRRLFRRLAGIGIACCLAAAVFSPWWGRNLALTGNPVHPTLQSVFRSSGHLNPEVTG